MKKENYEKPEAEIIIFEPRDVITGSGGRQDPETPEL